MGLFFKFIPRTIIIYLTVVSFSLFNVASFEFFKPNDSGTSFVLSEQMFFLSVAPVSVAKDWTFPLE